MYAIAFDLKIDDLKKNYGDSYNKGLRWNSTGIGNTGFWMDTGQFICE